MNNKLILILLLIVNLNALENLTPKKVFQALGDVQSLVFKDEKLYAGTNMGTVEIFDIKTQKRIFTLELDKIKDFMGDLIPAKIYSIDVLEDKILIVSQGEQGYRNIFLFDKVLEKLVGIEKNYLIVKAKFISDKKIVFALLSNQVGALNINTKELLYLTQISYSSFSDFAINEDKKLIATSDESGIVKLFDVQDGEIIKELEGINLDKVYQLDFKNGLILTAGQDRKAVVFKESSSYFLSFDFLLYSCGLSPSADLGAIAYNESNEILIFNTNTKEYLFNLTKQEGTLTQILFINEEEIFVSSESSKINYFNLKEK